LLVYSLVFGVKCVFILYEMDFLIDIQLWFSTCNFQKEVEEDGKLLPEFEDADESEWLLLSYSVCPSFAIG
jgi:hypothetical protein